jgi:hypothetical protein
VRRREILTDGVGALVAAPNCSCVIAPHPIQRKLAEIYQIIRRTPKAGFQSRSVNRQHWT